MNHPRRSSIERLTFESSFYIMQALMQQGSGGVRHTEGFWVLRNGYRRAAAELLIP